MKLDSQSGSHDQQKGLRGLRGLSNDTTQAHQPGEDRSKDKYQGRRGRLTYQKKATNEPAKADLVPGRERSRSWIEKHSTTQQPTQQPALLSDDNVETMVKLYSDFNIYSVLPNPEWN